MKTKLTTLILAAVALFAYTLAHAGQYQYLGLMSNHGWASVPTNSGIATTYFYGSTNTGTFYYDDAYNTNRGYVKDSTGAVFIPYATNATTGGLVETFSRPLRLPDIGGGGINTNAAISVYYTRGIGLTNTATLSFVKSGNNGITWDTNSAFTVTLSMPGLIQPATLVTNVPPWLLTGASHIRLWKVTTGTNSTESGGLYSLLLFNVGLSTFVP